MIQQTKSQVTSHKLVYIKHTCNRTWFLLGIETVRRLTESRLKLCSSWMWIELVLSWTRRKNLNLGLIPQVAKLTPLGAQQWKHSTDEAWSCYRASCCVVSLMVPRVRLLFVVPGWIRPQHNPHRTHAPHSGIYPNSRTYGEWKFPFTQCAQYNTGWPNLY